MFTLRVQLLIHTVNSWAVCFILQLDTRPDVVFAVQPLFKFLECHGDARWEAAKCFVRYLKGTPRYKLYHEGGLATSLPDFLISTLPLALNPVAPSRVIASYLGLLANSLLSPDQLQN